MTNRQYAEFVEQSGYQRPEFWKQPFVRAGKIRSWQQALTEFRDSTGRPGPASWEAGRYPPGQEDYPVTGVSWFEAAAYAEFARKSLPTLYHWHWAAGTPWVMAIVPFSNFSRKGPAPVGQFRGVGPFDTVDMAGNVKEWVWTETGEVLRFLLGGGWSDPTYQFFDADARSPWDRSAMNGFRCMRYLREPPPALLARKQRRFRDYSKEKPVSEEAFALIRPWYECDRSPLNARIEEGDTSAKDWTGQKITVDAAYDRQRLPIFLFLPKTAHPPYQVVVYCPGATPLYLGWRSTELVVLGQFDFIVASGRAVAYPVYFDMYERRREQTLPVSNSFWRERSVNTTKDLSRTIDYLETRPDLDASKIAYLGFSYGASEGVIWSTIEPRIKAVIYQDGGFPSYSRPPDYDPFHFAPRQTKPVLMLNGRYDYTFPLETSQLPLFRLLGTPAEHKRHVVFDTGHGVFILRAQFIREVLNWLDKYLGPVGT